MSRNEVERLFAATQTDEGLGFRVFHWRESPLLHKVLEAMEKEACPCEVPDAFFPFDGGALMVEHFTFDATPRTSKGSYYQREIRRMEKELDWEKCADNNIYVNRKTGQPLSLPKMKLSLNAYRKSLEDVFQHHSKRLPAYLRNVSQRGGVTISKIIKCFLIQDITPLTPTLQNRKTGERRALIPSFLKECWNLFEKSGLDCLLFAVRNTQKSQDELLYWECGDPSSSRYWMTQDEVFLEYELGVCPFAVKTRAQELP